MSIGFAVSANSLGNMNFLFIIADKRMYEEKKAMKHCSLLPNDNIYN